MDERPSSADSGRLTVVLLTYNCAHRLAPVLEHLIQTGAHIIAVDNTSKDGTLAVLRRYPNVEMVELPQNLGAAARNIGAERAATPYVAFCDDDGWYDRDGLQLACDLLDEHPTLAVVNARILVGPSEALDPISSEMAQSPIVETDGIPGAVLFGFMAGSVVVRRSAFLSVGGYDARYFMGGEEETVAFPLAAAGWAMRYVPEFVAHHHPSLANATRFRAHGMRNTIVNAWLHRPALSALRWTAFTLADSPKNRDYLRAIRMTLGAVPWIIHERHPMSRELDQQLRLLDARRFAQRRPFFTRRAWSPADVARTEPADLG